ncbi:MAG TPA: GAF domain-containing protein [Candidatus Methylomirabilis sp.]|nr:GAF domain-containing protein [Candidatus Methylomirabilis sp.]
MKTGRLVADLLTTLGRASSPEAGFARAARQLVALSGAAAGGLCFKPARGTPLLTVVGARRGSGLDRWLRARLPEGPRGMRVGAMDDPPAGWRGRRAVMLSAALGEPGTPLGRLVLLGSGERNGFRASTIPSTLPRDLGLAMLQIWGLHQRTLRLRVINEITTLMATTPSLERIYRTVTAAVGRLIRFDGLGITLLDHERGELRVLDVAGRTLLSDIHDRRIPMGNTLADWVAEHGTARRVDDVADPSVPPMSRDLLLRRGFRSAILAPLFTEGVVIGTLNITHRDRQAFADADVEVLTEVARPLAFAIEQSRLHAEVIQRAEELAALNRTSQLITARLDLGSLLDTISRSVAGLVGSTGCGIGLLTADRTTIEHVAAHGFRTPEWRALSVPVGEGIIGSAAASGKAVLSSDLRADPRSVQRDVDEKEGIRSMLSVPLRVAAEVIGVISAFSTTPNFFTARHQALLESFADQAGIAIQNARLFAESQRRARETQALYEAGRTVNQSLEVGETIRLILNQAREVLGVQSCGLFTLDPATGELASAASLDLEAAGGVIRVRVGEGITGLAVKERRPVQSADLFSDPRHVVRYRQLPAGSGLRSMLAAPLLVGDSVIGALTVLRGDIHHFTPEEESLVAAFADQAAMALEHARLYSSVRNYSEQLEAMVATRTQELDEQKRFVEVVLETLPLGLFLLDGELRVLSANRAGTALLPFVAGAAPFPDLVSPGRSGAVRVFIEAVLTAGDVRQLEEEVSSGSEPRTFRLTAAPLAPPGGHARALVLVEDITLRKRLEQQMLLTERLSTAGRMAAGVAHELNNPLATIAGCAEALKERSREHQLSERPGFEDFASYLSLIEEEAYRCKEITASLLHFVRDPGRRRTPTDLNALVDKVLELLSHQPRFAASQLVADLDPALPPLIANEGHLRQVFLGLSANALEAMEGQGTLTVRTRRRSPAEIEVVFEDQGPGIPDDILPRIFDPFFTTKPPSQGTGLGLAIAQGIVADHAGRIEVIPRTASGAVFRVIFPASSAEEGTP